MYLCNIYLYKEFSMLTTSKGLLRAEISVNSTMSLKKTVTQSNCSALTSQSLVMTFEQWSVWPWPLSVRPWPLFSSWAVLRPLSVTSDRVTCQPVSSRRSTPQISLEASERVWPFCLTCLQAFSHTRDSKPGTSVRDGQAGLSRDSTPGRSEWLRQGARCIWSCFGFPVQHRHSDPKSDQTRQIGMFNPDDNTSCSYQSHFQR